MRGLEQTARPEAASRHYHALDLLRGFAALVVCLFHVSFLFLPDAKLFSSGYLCVDLFFVLSGFVIAANYDRKIAGGMSLRMFLTARIARLYPLFAMTTLLGFLAISAQQYSKLEPFEPDKVLTTLASNIVMLPSFLGPWRSDSVFPFNGATWSIFFELWANIAFFALWRRLHGRMLAGVIIGAALALVTAGVGFATLDLGWGRDNFVAGAARVTFSFFLGVAIYRSGIAERARLPGWSAWVALLLLAVLLHARDLLPHWMQPAGDIATVLLAFPLAVTLLACTALHGLARRLAALLGGISYSVYLLQTPLMVAASGIPVVLVGRKIADYAPAAGVIFLILLLVASFLVWRWFELPAKTWVRQLLQPGTSRRLTASPSSID